MNALEELLTRSIDDGTDRMAWLLARQGRITASMVGKMALKGAAERRRVIEESFLPPVEITGNKYIDRGHEREPVIAAWIASYWPTIEPNVQLFVAKDNRRHAATPDGIGLTPKGALVLAEIKTSKYDRSPEDSYFPYTGYYEQMQWQMYVTGAVQTLYVWEQHDDDWEDGPHPVNPEPGWRWIFRDEPTIERLVAVADLALAERDAIAARTSPEEPVDDEVAALAIEVLEARKAKAAAEARLKAPWTRLLTQVSEQGEFSRNTGSALVTWSNREAITYEPDEEAALAAPVEGLEGVTGNDLLVDYQLARDVWETHLARFTKPVTKSVQKLTITEPKPSRAERDDEQGQA